MISVAMITSLYRYNRWANRRILDTAQQVSNEQWLAHAGVSFPSVRDTLVHIMQVQYNWLHRFQNKPLPGAMSIEDFQNVASIRTAWDAIDRETDNYLAGLTESDLSEVIQYVNSRGEACRYVRWQMLLHQVNHGTQHRSEVAVTLTQLGYSPGWLDYLVFVDEQGSEQQDSTPASRSTL